MVVVVVEVAVEVVENITCLLSGSEMGCAVLCLVPQPCLILCDPMDYTPVEFSRPEYWSG